MIARSYCDETLPKPMEQTIVINSGSPSGPCLIIVALLKRSHSYVPRGDFMTNTKENIPHFKFFHDSIFSFFIMFCILIEGVVRVICLQVNQPEKIDQSHSFSPTKVLFKSFHLLVKSVRNKASQVLGISKKSLGEIFPAFLVI